MVDFAAWESVGLILDASSGVIYLALAAAIAAARPATKASGRLALCLGLLGLGLVCGNLRSVADSLSWLGWLYAPLMGSGLAAAVWLSMVFPRTAARLPVPAAAAAIVLALGPGAIWFAGNDHGTTSSVVTAGTVGVGLLFAAFQFLTLFPAFVFRRLGSDAERQQALGLSWAFMPLVSWVSGYYLWWLATGGQPQTTAIAPLGLALFAPALAVVWLIIGARSRHRGAMVLALASLVITTAALVFSAVADTDRINNLGFNGVLRVLGAVLLAYAILRNQLLGLDVRVKVTVRQSTVAAIFIAAFFVVSEIVSGLLSDRMGLVAGVLTTGVLVFAIHPLQSVGQRVADAAMPTVQPPALMAEDERHRMYRDLAASAWADGNLSKGEGRVLETARGHLALSAEQALRLEAEARE